MPALRSLRLLTMVILLGLQLDAPAALPLSVSRYYKSPCVSELIAGVVCPFRRFQLRCPPSPAHRNDLVAAALAVERSDSAL